MKKGKVIIIVIAAILVITGIVLLILNNNKKKDEKFSEASAEIKTKASLKLDYFINLTKFYSSTYNGVDILLNKDKTETSDISDASLLRIATEYIANELDSSVQNATINQMVDNEGINRNNYTFYDGEKIRQAIKDLFDIDFKDKSVIGEQGFKFNYEYYEKYDMYLVALNGDYVEPNTNYQIDYKILKTEENKAGDVKVEFAVAYVYADRTNSIARYAKEADSEDYVYDVTFDQLGIKEEDKFNKYTLTLTKKDNNLIFKSIEKE